MSAWTFTWHREVEPRDGDARWVAAVRAELARGPQGAHLSEDTWLALARGIPPADAPGALSHVARCAECRDVLRAVRALDVAAVQALGPRHAASKRADWRSPLLAAAAVLLVLGIGWAVRRSSAPTRAPLAQSSMPARPASPVATVQAPPTDPAPSRPLRPDWLRATPPAIALYSPGALTVRGTGPATLPDALAEALAPWRAGRYAEAARRLEALGPTYPDAVEVPFYSGVAWLLSGAPGKAIAPLRRTLASAPPSLHADAAWYLGLALLDSAQHEAARKAFADGCRSGLARACDAARFAAASGDTRRP